jgi:hypothetical protein
MELQVTSPVGRVANAVGVRIKARRDSIETHTRKRVYQVNRLDVVAVYPYKVDLLGAITE